MNVLFLPLLTEKPVLTLTCNHPDILPGRASVLVIIEVC